MKKKYVYFISLLFAGCTMSENYVEYSFSHSDFSQTINLKGSTVEVGEMMNPDDMFLVCDTLILASNDDPAQREKLQLFSLITGKRISSFGAKGHARNELVSCGIKIPFSSSDIFYIDDITQSRYWECSIDSLVNGRNPILNIFDYSKDVISILPIDTTYIGFNFWYLNDSRYNNGIEHAIGEYEMKESNDRNRSIKYSSFVANVTGGVMVRNPHNNDIWVAYNHDNLIEIYDSSLQLKRKMMGPDNVHRYFTTERVKNKDFVLFEKDKHVGCYYAAVATERHVYLLYRNINNVPFPRKPQPVEIFKINWNGELLCNYQLDRYAYCISIDSEERFLYAACVNPNSNDVELVRYKLK